MVAQMTPLVEDWVRTLHALYGEYTDEELGIIADFMHKAAERQRQATERLGSGAR